MRTRTLAGQTLEVDAEGFLLNPDQWTPDLAAELATELGIALSEKHWQVLDFCRRTNAEKGAPPVLGDILLGTGFSLEEMCALFPESPGMTASRIAGLAKPRGCASRKDRKD